VSQRDDGIGFYFFMVGALFLSLLVAGAVIAGITLVGGLLLTHVGEWAAGLWFTLFGCAFFVAVVRGLENS